MTSRAYRGAATALAVLAGLVVPALASAQMTLAVTGVAGRTNTAMLDLDTQPINADECAGNVDVTLRFTGVPTDKTLLDVWSVSGSTDCTDTAARTPMTRTCDPVTLSVPSQLQINMRSTLEVTFGVAELVTCGTGDSSHRIYFLAADGTATTEAVTDSAYFVLRVDQTPPAAPTEAMGLSGDTQVRVTWTGTDDGDRQEYRVYGDATSTVGGADCDPSASVFTEGEPVPDGATLLATTMGPSATVDPRELGADIDTATAIVIVAVDRAGNESVASNVTCISRVPTTGFCDEYGDCKGCSASGGPGTPRSGGFGAVAIGLAIAAARLRRRSKGAR